MSTPRRAIGGLTGPIPIAVAIAVLLVLGAVALVRHETTSDASTASPQAGRPASTTASTAPVSTPARSTPATRTPATRPTRPPKTPPPSSPPGTTVPLTYTIKPGDNLWNIAIWFHLHGYGDLYERNKAVIGDYPNLIFPGQTITISSGGMTVGGPS
jgi:nucleoid-associated protein YgaU